MKTMSCDLCEKEWTAFYFIHKVITGKNDGALKDPLKKSLDIDLNDTQLE